MIEQASFKSFKNLRDVTVNFQTPLTFLVGPNASGKSSILEGLAFLMNLAAPKLRPALHPNWVGSSGIILAARVMTPEHKPLSVRLSAAGHANGFFQLKAEYPGLPFEITRPTLEAFDHELAGESSNKFIWHLLPEASLLRLEAHKLAAISTAENQFAAIAANGQGLASALADMASGDPARFAGLQDLLRAVVPAVRWVKVKRRRLAVESGAEMMAGPKVTVTTWGHKIFFEIGKSADIPAELASEGTLLTLGILALVEQAGQGSAGGELLLIDDLDRGLHPKAQRELIAALRRLLQQKPNLQIIATSHSPYLLDCLKPEEVCMTALAEDGSALCGSLTEHPEFPRWKDVMLPGEFWSSVGEDWLRGLRGRPDA